MPGHRLCTDTYNQEYIIKERKRESKLLFACTISDYAER